MRVSFFAHPICDQLDRFVRVVCFKMWSSFGIQIGCNLIDWIILSKIKMLNLILIFLIEMLTRKQASHPILRRTIRTYARSRRLRAFARPLST